MMFRTKRIAFVLAVAAISFVASAGLRPAFAAEPAIVHPYDTAGKAYIDKGDYETAESYLLDLMDKKEEAQKPEVVLTLCRLYSLRGRYEDVIKTVDAATGRDVKSARLDLAKGEALVRMGKNTDAGTIFENVVKQNPELLPAQLALAKWYYNSGKLDEAKAIFKKLADLKPENYAKVPEVLYCIGEAGRMSNNYKIADDVLATAYSADPGYEEPYVMRSRLYVDLFDIKYPYEIILDKLFLVNRRSPMGHVLRGWCLFYDYGTARHFELAIDEVNAALKYNPNLIEALDLAAYIFAFVEEYDKAQEIINTALAINPNSLSTLAYQGFLYYITGQDAKYAEVEKKVLALNPKCAEFYFVIGNTMDKKYGFKYSVEFCQKAIDLDPDFELAYPVLVRNLLFIGKEDRALDTLKKEEDRVKATGEDSASSYDPRIINLRKVMDYVLNVDEKNTVDRKTRHFILRMPKEEAALLGPYMEDLLETEWDELTKKYNYTPEDSPILIETFRDGEYFSARTTGVPGLVFATGASFGTFITALSPDAMHIKNERVDTYLSAWGQVVYHEFMHIISIQKTNSRISRWLTEGLSELEQKAIVASWGREEQLDFLFVMHMKAEGIIPVAQLDTAFLDLRTMQAAYYQAYLTCVFIKEKYGYEKFGQMMDEYRKHRTTTENIIQTCFGMPSKDFDKAFGDWCSQRYKDYGLPPQYTTKDDLKDIQDQMEKRRVLKDPKKLEALAIEAARACWQLKDREGFNKYADMVINRLDDPNDSTCGDIYTLQGFLLIAGLQPRYNDALPLFLKALNAKPKDTFSLYIGMGRCYENMKDLANAEKYFLLAKRACPTFIGPGSPNDALTGFYKRQGKTDEVIKLKEEYISYQDIDFATRVELLNYYIEKGDDLKAAKMILEILYVEPKYKIDHLQAADIFKKLGWLDKVGTEYEIMNVLAVRPQPEVYLTEAAKNFFEAGWIEKAKTLIIKALQAKADYQEALDLKKKIEEKLGKPFNIPAPEPESQPPATPATPAQPGTEPAKEPGKDAKPATEPGKDDKAAPPSKPDAGPAPKPVPKPDAEPPATKPAPGPTAP
jgi:tetratricopeptide (TPR) repeat protein